MTLQTIPTDPAVVALSVVAVVLIAVIVLGGYFIWDATQAERAFKGLRRSSHEK